MFDVRNGCRFLTEHRVTNIEHRNLYNINDSIQSIAISMLRMVAGLDDALDFWAVLNFVQAKLYQNVSRSWLKPTQTVTHSLQLLFYFPFFIA
jgi:hypothetical protein